MPPGTFKVGAGVSEGKATGGIATEYGTSESNTFKIQLYYMVAKARLVLATDVLNSVKTTSRLLKMLSMQFAILQIKQTAYKIYLRIYLSLITFANQAAFDKEFDYASTINVDVPVTAEPDARNTGNFLYVPKNNHALLSRGQSSYFAIKADFKPNDVITKVVYDVNTKVAYTKEKLTGGDLNYIYTVNAVEGIPAGTYFENVALFEEAAWIMKNNMPFDEKAHREDAKALVGDPTSTKPTVGGE